MRPKTVSFLHWFVKWFIPARVKYFCFMHIMAHSTTGKYSGAIVPHLLAMDVITRYAEDKAI